MLIKARKVDMVLGGTHWVMLEVIIVDGSLKVIHGGITGHEQKQITPEFIRAVHVMQADWTAWKGSYNLPNKLIIPNAELKKLI